jgi:alkylation response protein AidB-like acyl-CoA dehydrogenase
LIFEDCFLSDDQVLGHVGEGFIQAMKILDGGRISIASLALGIARGALETARNYSLEREQFGQPIARFQAIAFKIADMATQLEAANLLTLEACDLKMRGEAVTKVSAMAKYEASEVSVRLATEGVQILGGYGYTKDFPAEKFYRDSKLCTIGEGTSEIQKLVISRELLRN